ncbi:MAG: hypothetical protein ACE5EI_05400 [Thermodesulfobacteriota bacterium]
MKGFFGILIAAGALILLAADLSAGEVPSARERLAARDDVRLLYAVDETHSFVMGGPTLLLAERPRKVTLYGAIKGGPMLAYMVEHDSPQPFAYKNPVVSALTLAEGRVALAAAGSAVDRTGPTAADLFQLACRACSRAGATPTFVIPRTFGNQRRLATVSAAEAFGYIIMGGGHWYISCDGGAKGVRFLVSKGYRSLIGDVETALVRFGRALEGVNYVKAGKR